MIRNLLTNQKNLNKTAVIENGREILYSELLKKARKIMRHLSDEERSNIAILLPNGADFISALWGTIMSGAAAFPINSLMTAYEIIPLLIQSHAKAVIYSGKHLSLIEEVITCQNLTIKLINTDELIIDETEDCTPVINICSKNQCFF